MLEGAMSPKVRETKGSTSWWRISSGNVDLTWFNRKNEEITGTSPKKNRTIYWILLVFRSECNISLTSNLWLWVHGPFWLPFSMRKMMVDHDMECSIMEYPIFRWPDFTLLNAASHNLLNVLPLPSGSEAWEWKSPSYRPFSHKHLQLGGLSQPCLVTGRLYSRATSFTVPTRMFLADLWVKPRAITKPVRYPPQQALPNLAMFNMQRFSPFYALIEA